MEFGYKILDYWNDILKDLETMTAIPSVSSSPEHIYPFGKECAKAIDAAMDMTDRYGLKGKNVDYYAMHAEYGSGDENAVVMAHLDVVPAGGDWDTDPFTLTIKDGKAYGRGVMDDKGSAIVLLHCLRALKDANVQGKRKMRVVLGSSEETGMTDMPYYFAREQHPTIGFTPDGEYGVCNCEKGILNYTFSGQNDSNTVISFESGTVLNAVPDKASAVLKCSGEELEQLKKLAQQDRRISIAENGENITVSAKGAASHASIPETGENAAALLIYSLYKVFNTRLGSFFTHIYEKIGLCYDGSQIGIAMSDTESGNLTFNLGIVHADAQSCSAAVDIRYPATKDGNIISDELERQVKSYGLGYNLTSDSKPLYVPKDSKLIKLLSKAYTNVTDRPCSVYSMGGGTYARQMFGKGVAFGPVFPDSPDGTAHTANEFVHLENLKRHAQICMEAMYLMFTADKPQ